MNSVRSNNISLKYQRFTTLGSKDKGIIKSEFVAKTQFLCILNVCRIIEIIHFGPNCELQIISDSLLLLGQFFMNMLKRSKKMLFSKV